MVDADVSPADAISNRLFSALVETVDVASTFLGVKLGLYQALATLGSATSSRLAGQAGTNERYTREWLEHQAGTGLIDVATPSDDGLLREYRLLPGTEAVMTDTTGELPILHFVRSLTSSILAAPQVAECFRTGKGLPFGHFGEDMRIGQALGNRWGFMTELGLGWIPAMPDIHEKLLSTAGARIADIGFGEGWSSIAFANAYPNVKVDGLELDEASVRAAQANADKAGVGDRVRFHMRDAADPELAGQYDLAFAFECVHDMANPVAVLGAMRRLVGTGGTVLIVDEKVSDTYATPLDDVERLFYG